MLHVSIVVGYPRPKREKSKGGHSIIYSRIIIELWGKRFFFGCNYLEYIHIYIFWRYGTGPFQILHLALVLVWESWLGISNPIPPLTQKPFTSRHSISSPTCWILSHGCSGNRLQTFFPLKSWNSKKRRINNIRKSKFIIYRYTNRWWYHRIRFLLSINSKFKNCPYQLARYDLDVL